MVQALQGPLTGDGATITISGAGVVSIPNGGVGTAQLAANAATAAKVGADVATQAELDVVSAALAAHDALGVSAAHGLVVAADLDPGAKVTTTPVAATGSSASGSAGTAICSIAAAAGKRLTDWFIVAFRPLVANTQIRLTATMADDTTRTIDCPAPGGSENSGLYTAAGGLHKDGTGTIVIVAWSAAIDQAVKSIAATTLGAGAGTRIVAMHATEAPA